MEDVLDSSEYGVSSTPGYPFLRFITEEELLRIVKVSEVGKTRGEKRKRVSRFPHQIISSSHQPHLHNNPPRPSKWQNKASSPYSALQSIKEKISSHPGTQTPPSISKTSPPPSQPMMIASSSQIGF